MKNDFNDILLLKAEYERQNAAVIKAIGSTSGGNAKSYAINAIRASETAVKRLDAANFAYCKQILPKAFKEGKKKANKANNGNADERSDDVELWKLALLLDNDDNNDDNANGSRKNGEKTSAAKRAEYKESAKELSYGVKSKQQNVYIELKTALKGASDSFTESVRESLAEAKKSGNDSIEGLSEIIKSKYADNNVLKIVYADGKKVDVKSYAMMAARSARIETYNEGVFSGALEGGTDLVRCTEYDVTCKICRMYQGRVYSISGKDKRYPALYETALKSGYSLIHPNCRHQFLPFYEENLTKKELDDLQRKPNAPFEIPDKETEEYRKWQSFNRQTRSEEIEYFEMQTALGDKMPYKNLGSFRRAKRENSQNYLSAKKVYRKISDQKQARVIEPYNKTLVDSEEYSKKFDNLGIKAKVVREIRHEARRCIKLNDKTARERAVLIDANGKTETIVLQGYVYGVSIDEDDIKNFGNDSLILLHNHPSSSSFSDVDIITLSKVPQIKTIIAVGHNGTVYALSIKNGKRVDNSFKDEYNKTKYNVMNGDVHKTVDYFAKKYNWEYIWE